MVVGCEGTPEEDFAGGAEVHVLGVDSGVGWAVAVENRVDDCAFEAGGATGVDGVVHELAVETICAEVVDGEGEGRREMVAVRAGGTKEDEGGRIHWEGKGGR